MFSVPACVSWDTGLLLPSDLELHHRLSRSCLDLQLVDGRSWDFSDPKCMSQFLLINPVLITTPGLGRNYQSHLTDNTSTHESDTYSGQGLFQGLCVPFLSSSQQPLGVGLIIMSILQMRKPRHREVKGFTQVQQLSDGNVRDQTQASASRLMS